MLAEFRDQFDFHTRAEGKLRHSDGTSGMHAARAEDFLQQFRSSVRNKMLFGEIRRRIHKAE